MNFLKKNKLKISKSRLELWRIGVIWSFIFTIGIFSSGCEKEIQNNDEYYIKYIVNSRTLSGYSRTAIIHMEDNSSENFTFNNSAWEMTVGPVEKGFNASINARFNNYGEPIATPHIDVEIHISKNNEPFSIKASDISSEIRTSAFTSYTIN